LDEGITIDKIFKDWGANMRVRSFLPHPQKIIIDTRNGDSENYGISSSVFIDYSNESFDYCEKIGMIMSDETLILYILNLKNIDLNSMNGLLEKDVVPSLSMCCFTHSVHPFFLRSRLRTPSSILFSLFHNYNSFPSSSSESVPFFFLVLLLLFFHILLKLIYFFMKLPWVH
jgi:hypothetical protein